MVQVTLLEIHLEDASFTANAPFSGDEDGEKEDGNDEETTDGKRLGLAGRALLALFLAGAVAVLVRRLRDRGGSAGEDGPPPNGDGE